ncbi:hypothetical protein DFQ01_104160 [Paenibacillus cellulosilyticus]|uniref:Acyl carrier protein n=1 Tax=Paenibacillus cellulosilyticus TaxID=375489 RepID=A0A2V2YXJ1_9BACL|nr:hypothetical protein [Paenibacillus cellulosilyticus]PWW05600.1 hypothetical protein DFQ01_104160 [Paenibacillus cellulosilyticus]QKS45368.1 hypothetical protein HUB94_13790 [Paenibacillus cellulosilyticus]
MKQTELFEEIVVMISHTFAIPQSRITLETSIRESITNSPIELYDFLDELENNMGITILDDDRYMDLATVADLVHYVQRELAVSQD